MPNPNLTEIVVIVDRSGSMRVIQHDAQGGLNTFIDEQKKLPGEATLTLVQFDTEYEMLCENKPIRDAQPYVLLPRGATALLDAMGITITKVGERLRKTPEAQRPGKVLVAVITDGEENSSHEFTREGVFERIKHQREVYKWEFVFIAANQDAIQAGASYGITNAMNFAPTGIGVNCAYMNLSHSAAQYRSTGHIDQLPVDAEDNLNIQNSSGTKIYKN